MNEIPSQGPAGVTPSRPREVRRQFTTWMQHLQRWRSDDHEDCITLSRNVIIEIIEGVKAFQSQHEWHPIESAPKDGRFIWLSNGRMMRIGYWFVVTADPSQEHWADMIRAERGGMGDLQWEPKYWMPLPVSPDRSEWATEPGQGN